MVEDNITIPLHDGSTDLETVVVDDIRWYNACQVAKVLGYRNTRQSIICNVATADKKEMRELTSKANCGCRPHSIYINDNGLRRLILKSTKPNSIAIAKQFKIDIETKYTNKETEIISFIQTFLTSLSIPFEFQKTVGSFRIDLYLPEHKIAIEIDEFNHRNRCPIYERSRQEYITNALQCQFIRFNPDDKHFHLATCIAMLTKMLFLS